jgi:hypothetical protein
VAPEERAALATWISPAQLALFDSMHVADRRHGLDVAGSAPGARPSRASCRGCLHDVAGDTGVWPRVAHALAAYGA